MTEVETIMLNMYNALREVRYPAITKALPQNLATTILSGENRVALLSWLLSEKSDVIAKILKTLTGPALEDELLKYYTEIGICTKKELLLGTCSIDEQLPTLKFLLGFIAHVHIDAVSSNLGSEVSTDSILKMYMAEEAKRQLLCSSQSQIPYTDAVEYFQSIKQEVKCPEEKSIVSRVKVEALENETEMTEKSTEDERDKNELLFAEVENFLKSFSRTNQTFPTTNMKSEKHAPHSWDKHISSLYKEFSALKEVLRIKEEMSKTVVPEGVPKVSTVLDSIIQNIAISIEESQNI